MKRIVVGYPGGRDASVAIAWLAAQPGIEVIATTLDLRGGRELEAVRERALAAGAARAHVLEIQDEFARGYLLPALRAGALCDAPEGLASALARLLIAEKLVQIAHIERAPAIAHASAGDTPGLAALASSIGSLDPSIALLAPLHESGMTEADRTAYAHDRGIPESLDIEIVDGGAGRRGAAPAAERPGLEIAFDAGAPVALNGVAMPFIDLLANVATIDGSGAIPSSAAVVHAAHEALADRMTAAPARRFARSVSRQYAEVVRRGLWFTPFREALDAYVNRMEAEVSGTVRVDLSTGDCHVDVHPHGPAAPARAQDAVPGGVSAEGP